MREQDFVVCLLAIRQGYLTTEQLSEAAVETWPDSLSRVAGRVLSAEQRRALELRATALLRGPLNGSSGAPSTMDDDEDAGSREPRAEAERLIPLERPGQFTRLQELGRGGQSVVVRAFDEFVGREVALKELAPGDKPGKTSAVARARFVREARLTADLDHPGVVAVHDLAMRPDGTLVCVQKLVRGRTLKAALETSGSVEARLALMPHLLAACQAVAYAHARRVVHRDLKPANIMVGDFGETVVVDWGLAKHQGEPDAPDLPPSSPAEAGITVSGVALGTPGYMSPEQARGEVELVDPRSDVFSLGAVLHELLTGRPPHQGETPELTLEAARDGDVPPVLLSGAKVPPELAAIADRALNREPAARYADAGELAAELSSYVTGGWVRAYHYSRWRRLRRFATRHRALLAGAAIALVSLAVSATVVVSRLRETRLSLASTLLERGYRAQQDGDWSRAAGYFAASRVQRDSSQARWALAVANERVAERILSRQGDPETLQDVTVGPGDQVLVLGRRREAVEVRDGVSGRLLWGSSGTRVLGAGFKSPTLVRIDHPDGWTFRDALTGRTLLEWPTSAGFPCTGTFPPVVARIDGQLVRVKDGHILSPTGSLNTGCTVSPDGKRLAYVDRTAELHLVEIEGGRELGRRPAGPLRSFEFSNHGLVVFEGGRLEVMGVDGPSFAIGLPEARLGGAAAPQTSGTEAVSPDGNLVVMASRLGATHANVIDLGTRTVRTVLDHAPGGPKFAFSPDGTRVFAAGMDSGSRLQGWRLAPSDAPRRQRWWSFGVLDPDGRAGLLLDLGTGRYELLNAPDERVLATGIRPMDFNVRLLRNARALASVEGATIVLLDLPTNQILWEKKTIAARDLSSSVDGRRIALVDADGVSVWDTEADRRVFTEQGHPRSAASLCSLSRDGRTLAWSSLGSVTVRELETAREASLHVDEEVRGLWSGPGDDLLILTDSTASLWDARKGRRQWVAPNELPDKVLHPLWSSEFGAIIVPHFLAATELLDVRTGERLAWFPALPRTVSPVRAELYPADLRTKSVAGETTWDIVPLPQPDLRAPEESLAGTLARTGLMLRGVDLVAAP